MDAASGRGAMHLRARRVTRCLALAVVVVGMLGAAACGSSSSSGGGSSTSSSGGSAASTGSAPANGPVTARPYEVRGSDSNYPPLRLQGWVPNHKAKKNYTIGYFGNAPINTYVQAMDYGAQTAASSLGVTLDKVTANWDASEQINQLQTAMQQKKYDGIVVWTADPNGECRTIKAIQKAGIPVVVANFPICGDRDYTAGTVGLSTSQSLPYFEQYVNWAFSTLSKKGGGKVGVLSGPATFGQTKALAKAISEIGPKYPNVSVAQNIQGQWTTEGGLSEAQTILQSHPDVKMLLSSYDQNTLGAQKALVAAGKKPGQIMLFDNGGDRTTFPLLKKGWIEGIQYLEPMEEVGQGVEMLVAHLDGAKTPTFNNLGTDKTLPGGVAEVTKANVNEFVPQN